MRESARDGFIDYTHEADVRNWLGADAERKALEMMDREHAHLTEPDEPTKWCDGPNGCGELLRECTCPEVVTERDICPPIGEN